MAYHQRKIQSRISKLFEIFPIVSITGPRRAGKSTLINYYTEQSREKWKYYNLDDLNLVQEIKADPVLFARSINCNIAIDEAHKCPELFHSLKLVVDEGLPYRIIISGSANFLLLKSISESLAGRVGLLELQAFSIAEALNLNSNNLIERIIKHNDINLLAKELDEVAAKQISQEQLLDFALYGGFPALQTLAPEQRWQWFSAYTSTYIEKDLRDLAQVASLSDFQRTYSMLAFQTAQILKNSTLSSDLGIDAKTIKKYISILESSYQCKLVPAYHNQNRKRLIKKPKLYFHDTGLVNFFQKNNNLDFMLQRGDWGHILETHAFSEIYKEIKDFTMPVNIYHWRTSNDAEVDLVLEYGKQIIPIEIKSASRLDSRDLLGLSNFLSDYSKKAKFGIVLCRCDRVHMVTRNILAIPLTLLY